MLSAFLKAPVLITEYMFALIVMRCVKVADELAVAAITRAIENPVPRGVVSYENKSQGYILYAIGR